MLTQTYYTPRMDYTNYTSTFYPTPLTTAIYPISPPYSTAYDNTSPTSYYGQKTLNSSSLFLVDRPSQQSLDIYLSSITSQNKGDIRGLQQQLLPSPPLSIGGGSSSNSSSVSSRSLSPPVINLLKSAFNNPKLYQISENDLFSANSSGSSNLPHRKSVIMKIEDQRIMESLPANPSDNEEEFICQWDLCYRIFASLESLTTHVTQIHASNIQGGGLYFCKWNLCPRSERSFNARYKMLVHIRTHTKEKPYQCTLCTKSFSRAENLKIHMRSHSGEKPYICSVEGCTKAYSNSSDRFKHTRTHAVEKPYFCKVNGCNKRYTDPSSLRKHVKTFKHNAEVLLFSQRKIDDDNDDGGDDNDMQISANTYQKLAETHEEHSRYHSDAVPVFQPFKQAIAKCGTCDCKHKCFKHYNHSDVVKLGKLFNDVNIVTPPKKSSFWRDKYYSSEMDASVDRIDQPLDLSIPKL